MRNPVHDLPIVKQWAESGVDSVWAVLDVAAGAELAVAFTSLFWPEFIEVKGCVLLKERYSPAGLDEWLTRFGGDCSRTEAMINHTHLYDLFCNSCSSVSLEALEHLGATLLCTWRGALAAQFPARQFRLDLATEPDDYGPTIYVSSIR